MKKTFRALLLLLALVLCLTPALMACDSAEPDAGNETTNGDNAGNGANNGENGTAPEGRRIATYTSMDKTHKVKMFQVDETNGAEKVKCSVVLYTADGAVLDFATFDLKVNGEDVKFECFHKTTWHDDKVEVIVRDHDGAETTYTLYYKK